MAEGTDQGSMLLSPSPSVVVRLRNDWTMRRDGTFIGHCFLDGRLDESAIFDEGGDLEALLALLRSSQGFYSCIMWRGDRLVLIVDHMRSHPLFYRVEGNSIAVSDDARLLMRPGQDRISPAAALELLCVGYVTGDDTLVEGVKQVEAGTCVVFENGTVTSRPHYDYRPNLEQTIGQETYYESFLGTLEPVFGRLRHVLQGRQIALPLSGGLDSRLIALCLKRFDFHNVVAFSYGRPGNMDSGISKRVAAELGLDWYFVPYSNEMWADVARSRTWLPYYARALGLSAIPHVQDFPAVETLMKEGVIEERAVFAPGHRPEGAHLPPLVWDAGSMLAREQLIGETMSNHYSLWTYAPGSATDQAFRSRLLARLGPDESFHKTMAACLRENWFIRERSAKFIVNSVRAYEELGFDWWLPLLDKEFLDFWARQSWACKETQCYDRSVRALMREMMAHPDGIGEASGAPPPGEYRVAPGIRRAIDGSFLGGLIDGDGIETVLEKVGYFRSRVYDTSDYAFFGLVGKREFLRTWTGSENINSYLALSMAKEMIDVAHLDEPNRGQLRSIRVFGSDMLTYLEKTARPIRPWRPSYGVADGLSRILRLRSRRAG